MGGKNSKAITVRKFQKIDNADDIETEWTPSRNERKPDGPIIENIDEFGTKLTPRKYKYSVIKQLNYRQGDWDRHLKLCSVIREAFEKCEYSFNENEYNLSEQSFEAKFNYLMMVIVQCDHNKTSDWAWDALGQFPFRTYQNLMDAFIFFMKNYHFAEHNKMDIRRKWCRFLLKTLSQNYLNQKTSDEILDYLVKHIGRYEDIFNLALDFGLCDLSLSAISVRRQIIALSNQLEQKPNRLDAHLALLMFIQELWRIGFYDALYPYPCSNLALDYIEKLIDQFEDAKTNDLVWNELRKLSFEKFQYILILLINFIENKLSSQHSGWNTFCKMTKTTKELFCYCDDLFASQMNEQLKRRKKPLIEEMNVARVWKILRLLPFEKFESIILHLIDSIENKLNDFKFCLHKNVCVILREILWKFGNLLSDQMWARIFNYIMNLIVQCDNNKMSDCSWNVLRKFPFHKYQNRVAELINFIENCRFTEHNSMDIHWKSCKFLLKILSQKYLNQKTCDVILDYIVKHIGQYEDIYDLALDFALGELSLVSAISVRQQISALSIELKYKPNKLDAHQALFMFIQELWRRGFYDALYYKNYDLNSCSRLALDYIEKLIDQFEDEKTNDLVWNELRKLSFEKFQYILLLLINLIENKLCSGLSGLDTFCKMSETTKELFSYCDDLLKSQIIEQIKPRKGPVIEVLDEGNLWKIWRLLPSEKFESIILHLIDSVENELNDFKFCLHKNVCVILREVLCKFKDLLSDQICARMLNYLMKLIDQNGHNKTSDCAWNVLKKFPFCKFQFLINFFENYRFTEQNSTDIHRKWYIYWLETLSQNCLIQKTCDEILDYLVKHIGRYEDIYDLALDFALSDLSLVNAISVCRQIIALSNQLEQEPNRLDVHLALFMFISHMIQELWRKELYDAIYDSNPYVFDYIEKLIDQFEDEKTNDLVWNELRKLSFEKFQYILVQLINLIEKKLCFRYGLSGLDTFFRMSKSTNELFSYCDDLLTIQVFEQIKPHKGSEVKKIGDGNLWKIFRLLPFEKFESVLLNLINSIENKLLNEKQSIKYCEYDLHRNLCVVIREVLCKFKDLLSDQMCVRMFDYLVKLINRSDESKTIYFAGNALKKNSLNKHPSLLKRLVNSMLHQVKQYSEYKTEKLCSFQKILENCEYSLIKQIHDQMFDYLVELIFCRSPALKHFPFNNFQSSLIQFAKSAIKQLKNGQSDCDRHRKLCSVINEAIGCEFSLSQSTFDDIFNYLINLIELCDHKETIDSAWTTLRQFPLDKYPSTWTKLIDSKEDHLNEQKCGFKNHKKLCVVLVEQLMRYGYSLDRKTFQQILDYLTKSIGRFLVDKNNLLLMQLIDSTKNLLSQEKIETKTDGKLWETLKVMLSRCKDLFSQLTSDRLIDYLNHALKDKLFNHLYNSKSQRSLSNDFEFGNYEKEWCAHWENTMERDKPVPAIKLSPDRFGARNDRDGFAPVRSPFYVASGVYFYEVILVTGGKMQFGWSTREVRFDRWKDGDEGQLWVCFYVKQKCVRHNGRQWNIPIENCRAGDVIGCLIDFDERRFMFYHNGQTIECSSEIYFSSLPYHATARLSLNQQCYFNFGQVPFMFPLEDIQFDNFIEESESYVKRCQLVETGIFNSFYSDYWMYWFKHSTVDNRFDGTLNDQTQKKFDEMTRVVGEKIRIGQEFDEKWFITMKNVETDDRWRTLRFIQSIIEVMEGGDKVDVMALWIGRIIEDEIDQVWCEKLLELIFPYLKLRIESTKNFAKHRNICIVLVHLIMFSKNYYRDFLDDIHREMFTYLTRTLTDTTDLWTQLFAIIALANLKLTEGDKKSLRDDNKIIQTLNWKDNLKCKNVAEFVAFKNYSPILVQLRFVSEHFLNLNFNPSIVIQPNPVSLNPNDRTKHLKLSHDQLTARSDWKWQSVRSVCCVEKGICFFEGIILTNGPMRIGWSTQRTDLGKTEIGGDQFSIAFDGYNRCVWHNDVRLDLETRLQRWKAGDVIGCLIEVTKENNQKVRQFTFYLNGLLISYKSTKPIYSSIHPYHASISLESHQQVWLNFGQANFKYTPQKDFLSFYHYSHHKLINHQSPINLHNVINSLVLLNSNNTITGNVALNCHTLNDEYD